MSSLTLIGLDKYGERPQLALGELTPWELRVLIMSLDKRSIPQHIAESVGVTRTTITSAQARIRRKLAVPPSKPFREWFSDSAEFKGVVNIAEQRPWFRYTTAAPRRPSPERRHKTLERRTIADLQLVADRARAYAAALGAVIGTRPDDELLTTTEESVSLKVLAGEIDELIERAIFRERAAKQ